VTIKDNTISGTGTGIYLFFVGAAALVSNEITNVGTAFDVYNESNSGPSITSNTTKNTNVALNFECSPNVTVQSNTFSDSGIGFDQNPAAAPSGNSAFNTDQISISCP
jgi:nitrous oxidase accessory protein NosD